MADRPNQVLVIDDDESAREILVELLAHVGFHAHAAPDGQTGLELLAGAAVPPQAVLLDLRMPGLDGFEVLRRYRAQGGTAPVIALTAMDEKEMVVKAMRFGASDYLVKPIDPEELKEAIDRCSAPVRTPVAVEPVVAEPARLGAPAAFIATGPAMVQIWDMVDRAAETDVPVLIRGESGVGKEGIARTLHERSARRGKPFVKINCAALPSELLESELFGHERGAFTGATNEKPGKFELADHGTIFLDEIGEMHPALQAKLLQVLQDEEYYRVGGKRAMRADARVVVATNRVLEEEIARGNFREDLYYRLNVVSITVPPLRSRKQDIPALVDHFRRKYGSKYKQGPTEISAEVMRRLAEYDFPGNVRELENLVRRLVVLRDERFVLDELAGSTSRRPAGLMPMQTGSAGGSLPPAVPAQPQQPQPITTVLSMGVETVSLKEIARHAAMRAEREAIGAMLTRTNWNKRKAAVRLQISYKALLYKIKDCGLTDPRVAAGLAAAEQMPPLSIVHDPTGSAG